MNQKQATINWKLINSGRNWGPYIAIHAGNASSVMSGNICSGRPNPTSASPGVALQTGFDQHVEVDDEVLASGSLPSPLDDAGEVTPHPPSLTSGQNPPISAGCWADEPGVAHGPVLHADPGPSHGVLLRPLPRLWRGHPLLQHRRRLGPPPCFVAE